MNRIKKYLLISVLFWGVGYLNVQAESYVNSNGVVIDSAIVSEFEDIVDAEAYNHFTEEQYNTLLFLSQNGYNEQSITYVESNLVVDGEIIDSEVQYMTDEEYEIFSQVSPMTVCDADDVCWQTASKRLSMLVSKDSNNYLSVFVSNIWLTEPKVKSADVIAVRFNGSASLYNFWGEQHYTNSSGKQLVSYNNTVTNSQVFSNGLGISMNLVDAGSNFKCYLAWNGYSTGTLNIYASYQHATSNVTVADSKKYTLSSSGLGNVIKFNSSSISNKYDGMQGVSYTLS